MDRPTSQALTRVVLPVLAILASGGAALLVLSVTPADILGYDYHAYLEAARRLVEGKPLYDTAVDVAGGFAIYLYPPPFALLMIPFLALPPALGPWVWAGVLYAAFAAGCLAMPVRPTVRWLTLLAMGASWPVLYSLKLGQVGPLLVLTFALGWRWLDRPIGLGASIAAGTLIKLQPAALFGWAIVTRRWRAALVGLAVVGLAAILVTPFVGAGAWVDYAALLGRVSQPVTTPHNATLGAVLFQMGLAVDVASVIQLVSTGIVVVLTVWAWFRRPPVVGYLVTVVASQLVSPLLWDHYAAILALPFAFLLDRGRRFVWVIPVALSFLLVPFIPLFAYPVAFWVALVGLLITRGDAE